jgi:hypothetical protein
MPEFGRWSSNGGDPSLNEINRADQFFEALASKQPVYSTDRAEAELAFLFSEFRDDVREAPATVPVSLGDAVGALQDGLSKNRGGRRSLAIVGSVAAAVLCIGGFGTAVYGAGPGDSLYGMRTAMFGQAEATRDEQVSLASAQLAQVQQLIDNGQWQAAQDKLVAVSTAVQGVGPVDQKQQLVEQWNALTYKVVEQNPAATLPPPGEPLPVLPSSPLTWLPVPAVEGTTSQSTTTSESSPSASTTATTPSDSTAPSETAATTTPDASTTSPSSILSSSPPSSTIPSSSVPSPSPTSAPSSAASSPAPTSSPAASSPPSTNPSSTTTTTTTTAQPSREPAASQPTSTSVAVPVIPTQAPAVAPSVAVAPSSAATPPVPAERPSAAPATTTLPAPR